MFFFRFETSRFCGSNTWPTYHPLLPLLFSNHSHSSSTLLLFPRPLSLTIFLLPSCPLPFSSSTRDVWHGGLWLTQKITHPAGKLLLWCGSEEIQSIDVRVENGTESQRSGSAFKNKIRELKEQIMRKTITRGNLRT